nr:uncharacterized protein LOC109147136 [Ipomoea trifida]
MSKPLTDMLRKDAFQWSLAAEQPFEQLKHALCHAPVLALPDFHNDFVVEADTSYKGIGALLAVASYLALSVLYIWAISGTKGSSGFGSVRSEQIESKT